MKKTLAFILFLYSIHISGQAFYYVRLESVSGDTYLGSFNPITCKDSNIIKLSFPPDVLLGILSDIAITPDNKLYCLFSDGINFDGIYLGLINPLSGLVTIVVQVADINHPMNALVSDKNGILYGAGKAFFRYDPSNGDLTLYPDWGTFPGGDLTFYKGKLYFVDSDDQLVEVNLDDPVNFQVKFGWTFLPGENFSAYGITSYVNSCDSASLFLTVTDNVDINRIYALNFEEQTITYLCDSPGIILGSASPTEFIASDCTPHLDLDTDNSSLQTGKDFRAKQSCAGKSMKIADADATLVSGFKIDSVRVDLLPLVPDLGAENLTGSGQPGISINGNGTHNLLFVNDLGAAKDSDFAQVLQKIQWQNSAAPPTPGTRKVQVIVFSTGSQSDTAFAFIPVSPVISTVQTFDRCPGDSVLVGNHVYNQNGVFQDTLSAANGCDSLVSTTLNILSTTKSELNLTACTGGFANFNGTQIPAGTSQDFTLKSVATGCDSIVSVNVSAVQNLSSTLNLTACVGSFAVYNGTQIPAGTSQDFTLKSVATGCDSIVSVNVASIQNQFSTLNLTACAGSFAVYNGVQIAAGNSQNFTLKSVVSGCDSIVTVKVETLPVKTSSKDFTVCPGEKVAFNGIELSAGDTTIFQLKTSEGCDSSVTVIVESSPDLSFELATEKSCKNKPTGSISGLGFVGGLPPLQFSLDAATYSDSTIYKNLTAGQHTFSVIDAAGCQFEKMVFLENFPPLEIEISDVVLPFDNSGVLVAPIFKGDTSKLVLTWSNGAQTPEIQVFDVGKIKLEATNHCESQIREIEILLSDSINFEELVFIPNIFSPDADLPENDMFRGFPASGLIILEYQLDIYDRWGEHVFSSNKLEEGWRGFQRKKPMSSGVFIWVLKMKTEICGQIVELKKQGDVLLVK